MPKQVFTEEEWLRNFVEEETKHLDFVASWEVLCDVYETLQFIDPINDSTRLEEFKWIIKEMNKFLTRQKSALKSCKDCSSAILCLRNNFRPAGDLHIENRKALAYHKLRQRWIINQVSKLEVIKEKFEGEDDE